MPPVGKLKIGDDLYPKFLRAIKDPPATLYYRGHPDPTLFDYCVGVVGSRRMTPYGEKSTRFILSTLNKGKIVIISGFMYGVDICAHRAALEAGLRTIAVLPCGIDYEGFGEPQLYNEIIASGGLLLSEVEGNLPPKLWSYPRRNRIIAGLSRAVVIIEAALNSGSLITAEFAKEYKRKLFVVPGSIFSVVSKGCSHLLLAGATLLQSGCQINDYLDLGSYEGSEPDTPSDDIANVLRAAPMTLDELSTYTKLAPSVLSQKVTLLMLDGRVFERGGRFYAS